MQRNVSTKRKSKMSGPDKQSINEINGGEINCLQRNYFLLPGKNKLVYCIYV